VKRGDAPKREEKRKKDQTRKKGGRVHKGLKDVNSIPLPVMRMVGLEWEKTTGGKRPKKKKTGKVQIKVGKRESRNWDLSLVVELLEKETT